jgi:glyoxylase-like metal-dependent hydrolase (beta-lactamase superfamily II)
MTYAPPNFPPPPAFLFVNADTKTLTRVLSKQGINIGDWKAWISSYTCLLIETGKYKVLLDTGAGNLAPTTGKLLSSLKQEGIAPEDISLVILSHGHPDHVGGNINSAGEIVFPKAKWLISKPEWMYWASDQTERRLKEHGAGMLVEIARSKLLPLQSRIELIDKEEEIIPGIQPIFAPGHTPGHMAISLSDKGEHLLSTGDTLIHPVHLLHPEWVVATDTLPDQVIDNRHRILDKAVREKSLVMAFHFPFPGVGYVIPEKQGWQWQSHVNQAQQNKLFAK